MSKRLADILVKKGVVDRSQIDEAVERSGSRSKRVRLENVLIEMGAISDEAVARCLSEELSLPLVDPVEHPIDQRLLSRVPRYMAEQHQLMVLDCIDEGRVRVAMSDPTDLSAVQDMEFLLRSDVEPVAASAMRIRQAIRQHYDLGSDVSRLLSGAIPRVTTDTGLATDLELDGEAINAELRSGGSKPFVNLLDYLLYNAIERRASDIHVEPEENGLRIRYRIDGMLREVLKLPRWTDRPLTTRIKIVGKLDISEHRKAQDGKASVRLQERSIDLRISVVPTQFGEKSVLRILDPGLLKTDLGTMGWQPRSLSAYYRMVSTPQGIVLVVGPTGSGKSTTLYGTIERLRAENTSIVTVEDPIEYTMEGITQIQMNEKTGMTFVNSIRSLLRQDPDVIVVGEIRDGPTGQAALDAASTGHLVLSTLHTNNTVSTISRLLKLGLPSYLVGSNLVGIVAQRLVRRVCTECSTVAQVEDEDWRRLEIAPVPLEEWVRRAGPGCSACQYSGYHGRIGIYEVLLISDAMRQLIIDDPREPIMWRLAWQEGLTTLLDDALLKVSQGITTMEEIARVVPVDSWRLRPEVAGAQTREMPDAQPRQTRGPLGQPPASLPWRPQWAAPAHERAAEAVGDRAGDSPVERDAVAAEAPRALVATPEPAAQTAESGTASAASTSSQTITSRRTERDTILVVDDSEEILQLVSLALEDEYDIALARDGIEALQKVEAVNPTLMVLDVMLPRLSGYDVCVRLKEDPRTQHLPILMLSARGEKQAIVKGFYAGADDYLPKPFDPEELLLRISALIRRYKAH